MVIILAYKIKKSVLQISNPRKKRPKRQVSPALCRYFDVAVSHTVESSGLVENICKYPALHCSWCTSPPQSFSWRRWCLLEEIEQEYYLQWDTSLRYVTQSKDTCQSDLQTSCFTVNLLLQNAAISWLNALSCSQMKLD